MKRFISPLAARTANLNGPNEDRRKLTKTGFRSPLVNASKKEKAKEPPDLPAPSQSIVIEQATNLQHVAATQDEQVLSKAEPTLPGTQISGTTLATAPLHKITTSGLKKSKAFKAPAKAQHAAPEKGNKAGGQAHGSSGAGKSASPNGEPLATEATYYACLYFAKSKKKRPSQLDGVLQVSDTKCCLYSQEGDPRENAQMLHPALASSCALLLSSKQSLCYDAKDTSCALELGKGMQFEI
jgi:hypothetical protein